MTLLVLAVAYLPAHEVRFEFQVPAAFQSTALTTLPVVVALKYLLLRVLEVQRHMWQFTSLRDAVAIVGAMVAMSLLLLTVRLALPLLADQVGLTIITVVPLGVISVDLAQRFLLLAGVRALRRMKVEQRDVRRRRAVGAGQPTLRVVIIGAGSAGGWWPGRCRHGPTSAGAGAVPG